MKPVQGDSDWLRRMGGGENREPERLQAEDGIDNALFLVLMKGSGFSPMYSNDRDGGKCPQHRRQLFSIFLNSRNTLKDNMFLRFDGFELDPAARTLRREGQIVSIKPKTFDLLQYLAEHPLRPVSKEELLAALWPNSFVEERNLSQHVFLLRKALTASGHDDAVVITVPGKGYQFAAAVERVGESAESEAGNGLVIQATESVTRVVVENGTDERAGLARGSRKRLAEGWTGRRRRWVATACAAAVVLGVGAWLGWNRLHAKAGGHVQVVIADLDNSTGDVAFDRTLNKVVQIDLQQSPYFAVVGEERLRDALELMGRRGGAPISSEDVREACQRLNAQVYLTPAIASVGSRYLVTMGATACADGKVVGDRKEEADSKSGVLRAVEELTSAIRKDVGESRASLKQFDRPLYLERTTSLDALKAYSEAVNLGGAGKYDEAAQLYQRAIDMDPNFAIAYADLSSMYFNLGDSGHARENIAKAFAMRDLVNERERFYITYRYHESVTGDLHAMREVLEMWSATYPEDNLVAANLANHLTWIGQYKESADAAVRSLELNAALGIPPNGIALEIAARAFKHLGEYDRALEYYRTAVERKVDSAGIHGIALQIAALRHDAKEVANQIAWSRGTTAEGQILQQAGMAALADGRARDAERLFEEATAVAKRDHMEADLVVIDAYRPRILVEMGLTARAKELSDAFKVEDTYMDRLYAMAEIGDAGQARAAAMERQKQAPQDTLVNAEYVPSVYAALALRAGRPAEAVEGMQAAEVYEMRDPTIAYLRGQAFLAAGENEEAAAAFQRLIDNPGIDDPLTPLHALAHLNRGRALVKLGKGSEARTEYEEFFEAWKAADADLPALKQARAEMGRLSAQ